MYQRILVPIDGSEPSNAGLSEAIKLAQPSGATVQLMHVVNEYPAVQGGFYSTEVANALRDRGRNLLTAAEAELTKKGVKFAKSALVDTFEGSIGEVVGERAKTWPADLVVIGTHGRRGVARLVMGSDAQTVVRACRVPVLLVHESAA